MTLQEIRDAMTALVNHDDTESAHGSADDLLCDALRALAENTPHETVVREIIAAYNGITRWYA